MQTPLLLLLLLLAALTRLLPSASPLLHPSPHPDTRSLPSPVYSPPTTPPLHQQTQPRTPPSTSSTTSPHPPHFQLRFFYSSSSSCLESLLSSLAALLQFHYPDILPGPTRLRQTVFDSSLIQPSTSSPSAWLELFSRPPSSWIRKAILSLSLSLDRQFSLFFFFCTPQRPFTTAFLILPYRPPNHLASEIFNKGKPSPNIIFPTLPRRSRLFAPVHFVLFLLNYPDFSQLP